MNFNNVEEGIEYIYTRFGNDELKLLRSCNLSDLHFSLGIWI